MDVRHHRQPLRRRRAVARCCWTPPHGTSWWRSSWTGCRRRQRWRSARTSRPCCSREGLGAARLFVMPEVGAGRPWGCCPPVPWSRLRAGSRNSPPTLPAVRRIARRTLERHGRALGGRVDAVADAAAPARAAGLLAKDAEQRLRGRRRPDPRRNAGRGPAARRSAGPLAGLRGYRRVLPRHGAEHRPAAGPDGRVLPRRTHPGRAGGDCHRDRAAGRHRRRSRQRGRGRRPALALGPGRPANCSAPRTSPAPAPASRTKWPRRSGPGRAA